MRRLLRLAAVALVLYAGVLVAGSALAPAGAVQATTMSVARVAAATPTELAGRLIETAGRVTDVWRVGLFQAVQLADEAQPGSTIVILSTKGGVVEPGYHVRVRFSALPTVQVGTFAGPVVFIANSEWQTVG